MATKHLDSLIRVHCIGTPVGLQARSPEFALPPCRVRELAAKSNGVDGSIKVTWSHPVRKMSQVTGYDISYKKCSGSSFFRNKIVTYWHTSCILVCDPDGIEPLNRYEIKVRPRPESLNTEWTSITIYVGMLITYLIRTIILPCSMVSDWLCRFPGCDRNRRKDRIVKDLTLHFALLFMQKVSVTL